MGTYSAYKPPGAAGCDWAAEVQRRPLGQRHSLVTVAAGRLAVEGRTRLPLTDSFRMIITDIEGMMARKAFYSFHYMPDAWRAAQVRNMGIVEGNPPASDNDWESIKRSGDDAIASWIKGQMAGKSCTVVLIGSSTANRKWINHEIVETWNSGKGIIGVHIHNLLNAQSEQSYKGANPFSYIDFGDKKLSSVVPVYDPPFSSSSYVYDHIKQNLAGWIEEGIEVRARY